MADERRLRDERRRRHSPDSEQSVRAKTAIRPRRWTWSLDIILNSVIPLFSMIFVGFVAGKAGIMDRHGVRTLVAFVFTIAMPALLFRMMATTDLDAIEDWPIIGAYLIAQVPIFVTGLLIGRKLLGQSFAETIIQGFGSSFPNTVILGLPLALSLFGDRGGVPALLIIMLDILSFSIVMLLLEVATLRRRSQERDRPLQVVRDIAFAIVTNPLILASVLGILWALSGLVLPSVIERTFAFTGQAGPPAGLFALGASLSLRALGGNMRPVGLMVVLKLLLHPILTWLVVTAWFDLDPITVSVAILLAACPVGANAYVFAEQYDSAIETSATAVLVSTALAMVTISALILFGLSIPD
jgi:predicted permease